jgi:predicted Rossmann-fold nucleotide-binding protein
MEAANLGAWLAADEDDSLDAAVAILEGAPAYDTEPAAFLDRALEVRRRWPNGSVSLGVPTWLYVDEPLNQFSTHIAKYFQNSIRENGLLAIALGGVVYAPGGTGTVQEIFTDAAQNDYTMYEVRSPMIFYGREHYERRAPGVVQAVRSLATRGGWTNLVRVVDDIDAAVAAVQELAPVQLPRPARRLPLRRR